ncbi:MAG TPA: SRPBCC domain-containing protein [Candidatus Udaeobacter sp.]|jgi:carbon monoxide dehydrogenase subunit G|nr:SRPBCC domain-containing protein [Candidatus Udaeobacter sp.]
MKFAGNLTITRPVETVWEFLWDVEKLSRCIPGCQSVKTIKEREKYELKIKDSVGPITVQFEMLADVKKLDPLKRIEIAMEGKDFRAGGVRQTMALALTPKGNETEIGFETDVNVFGRLGTLGYPFVKKKAETVIKEFGDKVKSTIEATQ